MKPKLIFSHMYVDRWSSWVAKMSPPRYKENNDPISLIQTKNKRCADGRKGTLSACCNTGDTQKNTYLACLELYMLVLNSEQ